VVGDGVFDDTQERFVGLVGPDMVALQELDHETSEALEGAG